VRNFRKYRVWTNAMELVIEVYDLIKKLPQSEDYGLSNQLRRCAISIPSNIAEGSSRNSSKEFSRFIQISMGSSFELETQLRIVGVLYIDIEITSCLSKLTIIQQQLNRLNNQLKSS